MFFSFSPRCGAWLHSNTVWLSYLKYVRTFVFQVYLLIFLLFSIQHVCAGCIPKWKWYISDLSGYLETCTEFCGEQNRHKAAPFCSSSSGHQEAIALHLSAILTCLFRKALTTRDAPSPLVILGIAALNVSATVLWHYKLTVAFIKQEMKRGTANIGIRPSVRIPINSRCHCGHVGLSCANERASQLSAWWICLNAVSSWTTQRAGVAASSRSALHYAGRPALPKYHRTKWVLIVASAGVIAAPSTFAAVI